MNKNFNLSGKLLKKWQDLGYSADSARLLLLVPSVQTGWSDGYLQGIERRIILNFASDELGITSASKDFDELEYWLEVRPRDEKLSSMNEILSDWLDTLPDEENRVWRNRLLRVCLEVAQASPQIGFLRQNKKPQIEHQKILQIDKINQLLSI